MVENEEDVTITVDGEGNILTPDMKPEIHERKESVQNTDQMEKWRQTLLLTIAEQADLLKHLHAQIQELSTNRLQDQTLIQELKASETETKRSLETLQQKLDQTRQEKEADTQTGALAADAKAVDSPAETILNQAEKVQGKKQLHWL